MSQSVKLSRRSFMLVPLALAACKPGESLLKVSGRTMGTTYNVAIADAPRFVSQSDVSAAIEGALATVNQQMSNWDADSEISRFNAQQSTAPQQISPELAEVMTAAEEVHLASGGRFDTTLGPVIELWGFGADDHQLTTPSDQELLAAQAKSGHANTLRVAPGELQKTQADANVYLAAIGKGYGADLVGRALEQLGVQNYMIEIGGDLYASGHNADGAAWQIGIETPDAHARGVLEIVPVSNVGLASSGDYRNFFEQDGQRYSHLIDPRTGRPVTHNTAATTVIAENAMLADAWATAFHIIGQEEGLQLAEELGLAVLFTERHANANTHGFTTTASSRFTALTQV
ncbi:FAD:protein FMN transferase [Loktanella sp. S4079]|uniref:FAD:protein FMN transferase n=1 Tax=Loktanella sp. S4079 TaxID=579483 RepID=UPI0005FA5800|nr:FAD:protein FMN transferase [Loktanella sp. S4079]KJZ18575.1 thiamine biosynthesis protein ApbE [Loktanella sp. S4079]